MQTKQIVSWLLLINAFLVGLGDLMNTLLMGPYGYLFPQKYVAAVMGVSGIILTFLPRLTSILNIFNGVNTTHDDMVKAGLKPE